MAVRVTVKPRQCTEQLQGGGMWRTKRSSLPQSAGDDSEFINVVEAFAEFDGLLHGDRAVHGSLNLFNRVLASSIHERVTSKCSPGWARMCSVMERADLPKTSANTSSSLRLETVRRFAPGFFAGETVGKFDSGSARSRRCRMSGGG